MDKVFDCTIKTVEISPVNNNLPSLRNAHVSLKIGEEIKTRVLLDINDSIVLGDIPQKYYDKYTRLHFECDGYNTLDTLVLINKNICLKIERDECKYGRIFFTIVNIQNEMPMPNETLWVNDRKVISDNEGKVCMTIPYGEQRQYYILQSERLEFVDDTIEPPFTESSIIEVIYK